MSIGNIILSCIIFILIIVLIIYILKFQNKFKKLKNKSLKEYNDFIEDLKEKSKKEEQNCQVKIKLLNDVLDARQQQKNEIILYQKEIIDKEIEGYKALEFEKGFNKIKDELDKKRNELNIQFEQESINIQDKIKEKQKELDESISILEEFRCRRATINQAIMREKEIQEEKDFYRILIYEKDKEDIKLLRTIESKLNNREALNKLIFEVFYKKPLNDMLARVLENKEFCGIYKITNLNTGESYIGKSTNIKTRWIQHIKTSLDIGTIAKTKIHIALQDIGVDNFSFEVLEKCDKECYSEREKYWINFYDTQTFGYNIQK